MFFKDAEKPLYGLEIAQTLNASPGTTHRELNAMIEQGILKKKKEGALVMYRLNTHHPYFHELKKAIFPSKKVGSRVLFMSDARLSIDSPKDLINDMLLFFDYARENATELVLVGDMVEMLKGDVFKIYLAHKPLFDRLVELSHHLQITYIVGHHDAYLDVFTLPGPGNKFLDTKIMFATEYYNPKLGIYATYHREENSADTKFQTLARQLMDEKGYGYVVFGHDHKAILKDFGHGIYFNTGSWKSEKKRHFVEIDKEGGALVAVEDLR